METVIDWSKAPEWVVAHGLHNTGFGMKEFWLGETKFQSLEHTKSFPYGGGDPSCDSFHNYRRESFSYVTPRPAPWTGEGLPPVGTVCEFAAYQDGYPVWKECRVIAHDEDFAVINYKGNYSGQCPSHLRPIRSPEQIAADKRDADIQVMRDAIGWKSPYLGPCPVAQLYDSGYRKQVSE